MKSKDLKTDKSRQQKNVDDKNNVRKPQEGALHKQHPKKMGYHGTDDEVRLNPEE